MDQFTIKLAWDYTFMKQLCSKHETSMQEGLKVIKVQALIHLKTAPKSTPNDGQALMSTCKPIDPRLRHQKGHFISNNKTKSWHGLDK